jgi:TldD protein
MPEIDPAFASYPLRTLARAALERAVELGAEHADFRLERSRVAMLRLRDGHLDSSSDAEDVGLAVRVVHDGAWGFASGIVRTEAAARELAEQAVATAKVSRVLSGEPVVLAPEPVYPDVTWVSDYDIDPFAVAEAERVGRLTELSERLLAADGVDHVDASLMQVLENKFYADTAGTMTTQQRVRLHPEFTAVNVDRAGGGFSSMRTLAPPVGRGWEYLTGTGWDFDAEIAELPGLLREHVKAPSVEAGRYDLVIDPSNLWLTIHESIGHATELDRALGYEAAYAGTSFATLDRLGSLQYGSAVMNVTGDRTTPHGLASIGYDDEGVAAQQFDLIKNGVLVGYQLNRQMAHDNSAALGSSRSNGCAFADSAGHIPLQRMANVSLQPDPPPAATPSPPGAPALGTSTEDLIGRVERGIYVVGDRSWSIDMQRFNFQFTGQQFWRIQDGKLAGQLRDVAYQATTTDFWGSMEAVGGPQTYVLGGAFNCGKGQPGQVAAVSHGCPSALFRDVNVLNTKSEGGR